MRDSNPAASRKMRLKAKGGRNDNFESLPVRFWPPRCRPAQFRGCPARLSQPADHAGGPAAARRHRRHHGARGGRQARRRARPAGGGGKPRRRRQRHRHDPRGRQGPGRRLHAAARLHIDAGDRSAHVPQRRLRRAERYRPDRTDRLGAGAAAGASERDLSQRRRPGRGHARIQGAVPARHARRQHRQSPGRGHAGAAGWRQSLIHSRTRARNR